MMRIAWIFLLIVSGLQTLAQTNVTSAVDYFNLGASTFIREDQEKALAIVNEGLLFHPEDEALLKLKSLLEQQQDSSSGQNEQPEETPPQENAGDQEPADQDTSSGEEESGEQQPEPADQESGDEEQPDEQERPRADEMTGEEAEMVLDSLRQLEEAQRNELMQEMIRRQMRDMPPVEKDW